MKATKFTFICLLCMILIGSAISLVQAAVPPTATQASVWTSNVNDPTMKMNNFVVGQDIYIFWHSEILGVAGGTVNIEIFNLETDELVYAFAGGPFTMDQQPKIWTPTEAGVYKIVIDGVWTTSPVAVATVLVTPESVFGALSAIGAGVAAFGTVAIVKRKRA